MGQEQTSRLFVELTYILFSRRAKSWIGVKWIELYCCRMKIVQRHASFGRLNVGKRNVATHKVQRVDWGADRQVDVVRYENMYNWIKPFSLCSGKWLKRGKKWHEVNHFSSWSMKKIDLYLYRSSITNLSSRLNIKSCQVKQHGAENVKGKCLVGELRLLSCSHLLLLHHHTHYPL